MAHQAPVRAAMATGTSRISSRRVIQVEGHLPARTPGPARARHRDGRCGCLRPARPAPDADLSCLLSSLPKAKAPRGMHPRGQWVSWTPSCLGLSRRSQFRPCQPPSPIRTLPSAPASHRICLASPGLRARPSARWPYRRSGFGAPHPAPKVSRLAAMILTCPRDLSTARASQAELGRRSVLC